MTVPSSASPRLVAALADRYHIERAIGQGGMATVFLARDLKHDRLVALKVLRPELAAVIGGDRFLAEIKTTANLQHPHILPLHDSGEADGTVFYVMPYVEGETLRDRLTHEKQLPVEEAVRIAREVAGALDYAHRHGVVHRDIKPENILLHDGQALVADFGISLAVSRSDGGTRMTETGMSLGTPHYMAPEQAMGQREITARADIYAIGAVLYEMLTGEPPFTGSTAQAIVARAVTESPRPITIQRHTVPPHVEATTLKALEKLPADRFATAAEFSAALEKPELTIAETRLARGVALARADWRSKAAIPLAGVAVLALGAIAWLATRPAPAAPLARIALYFPDEAAPLPDRAIAISPDGEYFAYVGVAENGGTQVWLKARGDIVARPVPGSLGSNSFTFSPDGRWLALVQNSQLRKWPLGGGAATTLAEGASGSRGVAWLDDGTVVFGALNTGRLDKVSDAGGTVTTAWKPDSGTIQTGSLFPTAVPGGKVIFSKCLAGSACPGGFELSLLDPANGRTDLLAQDGVRGIYTATGHLVYARRDGGLFAAKMDPKRGTLEGEPVPVLDSVSVGPGFFPIFAVSDGGTLLARTGGVLSTLGTYEFVWIDRTGNETAIDSSFTFRNPVFGANAGWSISPDGNRVALSQATPAGDNVWVKELPKGPVSRITFDSNPAFRPRWTRDGRFVTYHSRRGNNTKLFRRPYDGTGTEEMLFQITQEPGIFEAAWTPDGKTLVLRGGGTVSVVGGRDIMVVRPGVDSAPRPLVATEQFDESGIALSPDGKWLAYESNETGRTEVYLRPFPDVNGGRWQVSVDGGRAPLWNRNGKELLYVNGARAMVSAPITIAGAAPTIGTRTTLFTLKQYIYLADQENYTPFDIAPDGSRFLMARRVNALATHSSPLVMTENWFGELRRIVGRK